MYSINIPFVGSYCTYTTEFVHVQAPKYKTEKMFLTMKANMISNS